MRIASWNVNSLRVRLPHVIDWLETQSPAVLGLQEIKTVDDDFPFQAFEDIGYQAISNGQKTYNGVALVYRKDLNPGNVVRSLEGFEDDQKRVVAADFEGVKVINLYVPNGQTVDSEKYHYKLEWLSALTQWLGDVLAGNEKVVVMGDFNIAPEDADVHDPDAWRDRILCSVPERQAFEKILDLGFSDTFRLFEQEPKSFSWWDYRALGFRRNRGLRIDLLLASELLAKQCTLAAIDKAPRKLERPSDHTPVFADF
ncbi:MAG: exodeoxyribonuclease III [Pseudomonadota bacterium]